MMTDKTIELSMMLRELPFNPIIEIDNGAVTVTLRPQVGPEVSGTAVSFALAYTVAINKMKAATLVGSLGEADYDRSINDFLAGTGRR